jgi:hypothetical protein
MKCTNCEWINFAKFPLLRCEMLSLWCSTNNSQINADELTKNKCRGKKNFKFHIQQMLNCIHGNYNILIRSKMRLWPSSRPRRISTLLHLKIDPWNQFETIVITKCRKIFVIVMATRCWKLDLHARINEE